MHATTEVKFLGWLHVALDGAGLVCGIGLLVMLVLPVGTVIGAIGLWVLLARDAKTMFASDAGASGAHTTIAEAVALANRQSEARAAHGISFDIAARSCGGWLGSDGTRQTTAMRKLIVAISPLGRIRVITSDCTRGYSRWQ